MGVVNDQPMKILVAEDDESMLDLLERVLTDEGYQVLAARNGNQALALLEAGQFDLMLTDVRMPGPDGSELLRRAMARNLRQPIIMMTAFGNIEAAVRAMRNGAFHYLAKPFDIEDLLAITASAVDRVRQQRQTSSPQTEGDAFFPIVFRSAAMVELLKLARDVASSAASVLIIGSSGTGKELLARAIHNISPRSGKPFVAVDCNALPETLFESELFGHRRGSFTGAVSDKQGLAEQADGGTLFFDEVGNFSATTQAKLLRFVQERKLRRVGEVDERSVDVRVISATNRDLKAMVRAGQFREDLFYRLAVIPLVIPDIRDRREDIAVLAYHFVRKFNRDYQVEGIRQDALDLLVDHDWPGNVRQIENAIERAVILRKAGLIQPRDLPEEVISATSSQQPSGRSLEEIERTYILNLLGECDGNQSRVARVLGINRRTLYRKLRKYNATSANEPE